MDKAADFLIHIDQMTRRDSLLGIILMHTLDKTDPSRLDAALARARERGGLMDVRLVIEGDEFTFADADAVLRDGWHRSVSEAVEATVGRDDTEIPVAMLRDVAPMVYDTLIKRRWEPSDLITRGRAFDEYCMWHGLVGWGPPIRDAMAALGWKLVG